MNDEKATKVANFGDKRPKQDIEAEILKNCSSLSHSVQRIMEGVPPRYRLLMSRIYSGVISNPKLKIKGKCLDCVGFEDAVGRIRDCPVDTCPIWTARPFQKTESAEDGDEE